MLIARQCFLVGIQRVRDYESLNMLIVIAKWRFVQLLCMVHPCDLFFSLPSELVRNFQTTLCSGNLPFVGLSEQASIDKGKVEKAKKRSIIRSVRATCSRVCES